MHTTDVSNRYLQRQCKNRTPRIVFSLEQRTIRKATKKNYHNKTDPRYRNRDSRRKYHNSKVVSVRGEKSQKANRHWSRVHPHENKLAKFITVGWTGRRKKNGRRRNWSLRTRRIRDESTAWHHRNGSRRLSTGRSLLDGRHAVICSCRPPTDWKLLFGRSEKSPALPRRGRRPSGRLQSPKIVGFGSAEESDLSA